MSIPKSELQPYLDKRNQFGKQRDEFLDLWNQKEKELYKAIGDHDNQKAIQLQQEVIVAEKLATYTGQLYWAFNQFSDTYAEAYDNIEDLIRMVNRNYMIDVDDYMK